MYFESPEYKGKEGEAVVKEALVQVFNNTKGFIFNDILVEYNGKITQIDHVVISEKGVFVVETKNYSGWIFGNQRNKYWTQVIYKNKNKFQNPLFQNYGHIKMLESVLKIDSKMFISIVAFTDNCEFKTDMPKNVMYDYQIGKYVRSLNKKLLSKSEIDLLGDRLSASVLEKNKANKNRHLDSIERNRA
ncbi:nuclease-related domain-containing protein [Cellulophaga lytica]|uniref:nuclease-related domain-containing protein n=1 Tax=Cellulophaga lytica TaxID=979 RepID=UPI003CE471AB